MIEYFPTKRLRFEISVLMDQRWQIVGAIDDGRKKPTDTFSEVEFDRLVQDTVLRARQILAAPTIQGVKVRMEAIRTNGIAISREVLSLDQANRTAERNVRHHGGDVPVCETYDDLLQRPALYTLGIILRPMLDRSQMTPLELVTLKAISRSVQKNQQAFFEATGVASRQQAAALGVPQRARMEALDKLIENGYARLRSADQRRDLPVPRAERGGFDAYMQAVMRLLPQTQWHFWLLRGLSVLTGGAASYLGKLDVLLRLDPSSTDDVLTDLLDESIAGILDQPESIRDLLGHQLDMESAIIAMRDFAQGNPPKVLPELTQPLCAAIAAGRLPKSAGAIWERIVRSLTSLQPLTKRNASEEWMAIARLMKALSGVVPLAFDAQITQALKKRQEDGRRRLLER